MSELVKKKIVDIDTSKSVKSVKTLTDSFVPLKKQIRDLQNEIATLDKDTEGYSRAVLKLAELQQRQREISEAAKFSNKDFGAVMGNLTTISAGLVGGLNAISASMVLLSKDSEEAQKALVPVQMIMAAVQGLAQIDNAIKAIRGFKNIFGGVGEDAAEAATEVGTLKANIDSLPSSKTVDVSVETDESGLAKAKEDIDSLSGKTVSVDVVADESAISEVKEDISSLSGKTVTVDVETNDSELSKTKSEIDSLSGKTVTVDIESNTSGIEKTKAEIDSLAGKTISVDVVADTTAVAETEAALEALPTDKNVEIEVKTDTTAIAATEAELEALPDKKVISVDVEDSGIDDLADSVSDLAKNETTLASTTATTAKATKNLDTTAAKATKGVKSLAQSIKNAAKALKEFILANPILAAIAVAIGAVAAAISVLNKRMQENGRIAREDADINTQVNKTYDEQNIRLNALLKTAKDENESLAERKAAVKELNKIVPEYNARINETTGALEASNKALDTYLANLKEKIKLEAYEGKIKEYYQKRAEVEEKINKLQTTGWFLTEMRIRRNRKELAELDKDIERMYGRIKGLDLSEALDTNKPATKAKAVAKLITDVIKELKKQANDFWDTFYGSRKSSRQTPDTMKRALAEFKDEISNVLHHTDLAKMYEDEMGRITFKVTGLFTKEFNNLVKNGEKAVESSFAHGFEIGDIFKDADIFKDLEEQAKNYATEIEKVIIKYRDLAKSHKDGKLTEAEQKRFEQEKKNYEESYNLIKGRIDGYNKIIEATYRYTETIRDEEKAVEDANLAMIKHDKQLDIERQYLKDIMNNNPYADINRTIANMELEQEMQQRGNKILEERLGDLKANAAGNKLYADEIKTLEAQVVANQQQMKERSVEIERNKYERRTQEVQKYFEEIDRMTEESNRKMANESTLKGLGTQSFDTAWKQQKAVVDAYKKKEEVLKSLRDQGIISEEEYNSRMLKLQEQLNKETEKQTEEHTEAVIQGLTTFVNVFNQVGGAISSILQQQMSKYDENSEEYKNLQIKEAWINTMSGTLSAFMSGMSSGVPAPYNAVLAAALAGMTFSAGAAQIGNIRSGNNRNAFGGTSAGLTSSAKSAGTADSQYQTYVYQQNEDLNRSVRDQKVYVLEHDISKVQKRVSVREYQSSF